MCSEKYKNWFVTLISSSSFYIDKILTDSSYDIVKKRLKIYAIDRKSPIERENILKKELIAAFNF